MEEDIKKEEQTESAEESRKEEQTESAEESRKEEQTETAEDSENETAEAEEFEDEDDWEDEEQEKVKPWKMALVFLGLILLAALICVVLWKSTHSASDDEQDPKQTVGQSSDNPGGQSPTGSAEPSSPEQDLRPEDGSHVPDASADAPPEQEDRNRFVTKDGRTIIFTDCDDIVSPKEYVNLRTEPSTSQGNDTVSCRLDYGENVHRTGFSADAGWSRVEYDGKELYVITSYVFVVEEQTNE